MKRIVPVEVAARRIQTVAFFKGFACWRSEEKQKMCVHAGRLEQSLLRTDTIRERYRKSRVGRGFLCGTTYSFRSEEFY
jgi:hypothetical protein